MQYSIAEAKNGNQPLKSSWGDKSFIDHRIGWAILSTSNKKRKRKNIYPNTMKSVLWCQHLSMRKKMLTEINSLFLIASPVVVAEVPVLLSWLDLFNGLEALEVLEFPSWTSFQRFHKSFFDFSFRSISLPY